MNISVALVAKGFVGASILTTASFGVIHRNEISTFLFNLKDTGKITKWDEYIKEAINNNEGVNFSLLNVDEKTQLSSFPEFKNIENEDKQIATAIIKIDANEQKIQTENSTLKSKNHNTSWTWKCTIQFSKSKDPSNTKSMTNQDKNAIYGSSSGLLWKITQNKHQKEKLKIIDLCSGARERTENKKLSNLNKLDTQKNTVSSTKQFELTENPKNSNNLQFQDPSDFNRWFERYKEIQ